MARRPSNEGMRPRDTEGAPVDSLRGRSAVALMKPVVPLWPAGLSRPAPSTRGVSRAFASAAGSGAERRLRLGRARVRGRQVEALLQRGARLGVLAELRLRHPKVDRAPRRSSAASPPPRAAAPRRSGRRPSCTGPSRACRRPAGPAAPRRARSARAQRPPQVLARAVLGEHPREVVRGGGEARVHLQDLLVAVPRARLVALHLLGDRLQHEGRRLVGPLRAPCRAGRSRGRSPARRRGYPRAR